MNFVDNHTPPSPQAGMNYGRHNLLYYPPHWWKNIPPRNSLDTRNQYVTVENRIHIFGILLGVTEEDIHEEFSFFGPIAAITIVQNQCFLQNGFAFVTYHLKKSAQLALQGSAMRFFRRNLIFVSAAIQIEKYIDYQDIPIQRTYSMKTLLHIKRKYDKYLLDQINDILYVNPCLEYLREIDATIPRHLKRSTLYDNWFSDNDSCSTSSTSSDDEIISDDESVYSFGTVTEIPGTPANSESTNSENSWKRIPVYFHGLHNDNDLKEFIYPDPQYFEGIQCIDESNNLDLHEDENPMAIENRHYNENEIIYPSPIFQSLEASSYPRNEDDNNYEYPTWEDYQEELIENVKREIFYINPVVEVDDHLNVDLSDQDEVHFVAFQPNSPQTCPIVYEYPVNIHAGAKLCDKSATCTMLQVAQFEPISPSLYLKFFNFDFFNNIFNQLGIAEIANYVNMQIKAFQGINPLVRYDNKVNDYMEKLDSILANLLEYVTVQENDQSCHRVHIIEISDQDNIQEPDLFSNDMERTIVENITSTNSTIDIYQPVSIVDLQTQFATIEAQFSKSGYQFLQPEECDLKEDNQIQKLETETDNYEELELKVSKITTLDETWEKSSKFDFCALSDHDVSTQVSEVDEIIFANELDALNLQTMATQMPSNRINEEETGTLFVAYPNVTKSEK